MDEIPSNSEEPDGEHGDEQNSPAGPASPESSDADSTPEQKGKPWRKAVKLTGAALALAGAAAVATLAYLRRVSDEPASDDAALFEDDDFYDHDFDDDDFDVGCPDCEGRTIQYCPECHSVDSDA